MITKETKIDQITITEHNVILFRVVTNIIENDVILSKTYARGSYEPGADLSTADQKVIDIAGTIWTPEIVLAWQNRNITPFTQS